MTTLAISQTLQLPIDAVTQTFGILAKRGVGKTYTACVMTEEMLKAGLHVVVVDPVGVWWGLRSSADGQGPGLPILIIGGDHADVPLEANSGKLVADLVVDERISAVLDLSNFSQGEQTRFMTEFADTLYHRNREPLHMVLDEADAFAPQSPMPEERRMLGAIERIVRRGRARGLGVTLITQRPAVLNKNVLTQIEVLVTLRMTGPQDRKAIEAWVSAYGSEEQGKELISSLADLPIGEAWFWSPAWLGVFTRVKIRLRETFDSSATPKAGQTRIQPKDFAAVDIDAIRSRMGELIAEAADNNPAALKRRIKELEIEVDKKPAATIQTVEVSIITDADRASLSDMLQRLESVVQSIQPIIGDLSRAVLMAQPTGVSQAKPIIPIAPILPSRQVPREPAQTSGPADISTPQQRILNALAEFESLGLTSVKKSNAAIFADQSPTSSGFTNNLGRLRTAGLIDYPCGGYVCLTDTGRANALQAPAIRGARHLREAWMRHLSNPQAQILQVLIDAYPESVDKSELARLSGQSFTSSGYTNNLGRLRNTFGLIDYPEPGRAVATDLLFPEVHR